MMKCRDCEYCKDRSYPTARNGLFYCEHPNKIAIIRIFKERRYTAPAGFICNNEGSRRNTPSIKTSPVWCPYKLEKKAEGGKC